MPGLIIWKNRELDKMKRDMDRLMSRLRNDFGTPLFPREERSVPYFEFFETDDALILKAEAAGVAPEDLDVHIIDNNLIIKGVRQREFVDERNGYRRKERRRGTFTRTLQIPCKLCAVRLVVDPASGRTTTELLPRFETVTYAELARHIRAVSAALTDVHPGDRVAVLGFTSIDYTTVDMALAMLGAVAVPLQGESLAGVHHQPLHLVVRLVGQDAKVAPGPVVLGIDHLRVLHRRQECQSATVGGREGLGARAG